MYRLEKAKAFGFRRVEAIKKVDPAYMGYLLINWTSLP